MHRKSFLKAVTTFMFFVFVVLFCGSLAVAGDKGTDPTYDEAWADDDLLSADAKGIADPLEPLNRLFFKFNDKLYFWVLKPVAKGYGVVVAEPIRISVRHFFHNLLSPIRVVNNLLQGKFKKGGIELARFVMNTTMGAVGLADPAGTEFGLNTADDEDFGQTLGVYGVGEGIYFCWPIFGPSNIRDTLGLIGDSFLNPLAYMTSSDPVSGIAVQAGERVNHTSLTIGDYEHFKESAFDPYVALRDAYRQYRQKRIKGNSSQKMDSVFSDAWQAPAGFWRKDAVSGLKAFPGGQEKVLKDAFYVQVGAFIGQDSARESSEKVCRVCKQQAVVKVYNRKDYQFYGVLVPAGNDFVNAKMTEEKLRESGFNETVVVAGR